MTLVSHLSAYRSLFGWRVAGGGWIGRMVVAGIWFSVGLLFQTGELAHAAGPSRLDRDERSAHDHWAFQPLKPIRPPREGGSPTNGSPIDAFIRSALVEQGRVPSPPADKRTLLRRATFDLIGLPPSPGEMEAFLADTSPEAFSRVVDRLLASPHYGERWGRHWLDVARYADDKGYVFFEEKTYPWAWTYRDYVIRAFNEDKPFDRFVLEQLAADQLDLGRDVRSLAALGFLTVGDHFSNNLHDILDDRIDVVFRGLLGLTVGCARCHDHKYDPITTADYYALYGVLRSSVEPLVPPVIEPRVLTEAYESFEVEKLAREQRLREFVSRKHQEIVSDSRRRIAETLMAVHAQRHQPATESFMLIADPGDINPVVISRWRGYFERVGATNGIWEPWVQFAALTDAEFSARAPEISARWLAAPPGRLNPRVAEVFAGSVPTSMKDVAERYAAVLGAVERKWQAHQTNEVHGVAGASQGLPDPADEALRRVLYGATAPPDVPAQLDWGFLSLLPDRASQGEFQKLLTSLEQWLMKAPEAPARAMVLNDAAIPFEPRVFVRGNPSRLGESVPRRFLKFLQPKRGAFQQGSGRLEMAREILNTNCPLAARVWVNRVWLHHFGAGLVTTPSDFGLRSEAPSHRDLLDWLAGEFIRGGWRVKDLHRVIMNSATYQQASAGAIAASSTSAPPEGKSLDTAASRSDPGNRWLGRMTRQRHDFETQRDAFLAVAGRLEQRLGGPPMDAVAPCRSVYTFMNRLNVPPVMTTFDFPSPSTSCPQRANTTVAPQALYLMNSDFVADCAATVARRAEKIGVGTVGGRLEWVYSLLFGRPPKLAEIASAEAFLGRSPDDRTWQQYIQALLMTNEFVFVD